MTERPSPTPEVLELTRVLAESQETRRDTGGTGCLGGFLIGIPVMLFTLLLSFPGAEAVREASFALGETRTAEASVVQVSSGATIVHFTTEEGVDVQARLPQDHEPDDPRTLEVTYRVDDPGQALAADRPWSPALLMFPVLLVIWILFELFHRRGLRAGRFWRRVRTLTMGPLTRIEQRKRRYQRVPASGKDGRPVRGPWTSAIVGMVLLLAGLVMVGASLVGGQGVWTVPASVSLTFGVTLLRAALYRHADVAPVTTLPRVFRPAPRGAVRWIAPVLLAGTLAVTIPTLPMGDRAVAPAFGTEVLGRAEIVESGCFQSKGGPCQAYVVIEYRADGMRYREELDVELLGMDDLVRQGTVDIAWDREDPRRVRLVD